MPSTRWLDSAPNRSQRQETFRVLSPHEDAGEASHESCAPRSATIESPRARSPRVYRTVTKGTVMAKRLLLILSVLVLFPACVLGASLALAGQPETPDDRLKASAAQ